MDHKSVTANPEQEPLNTHQSESDIASINNLTCFAEKAWLCNSSENGQGKAFHDAKKPTGDDGIITRGVFTSEKSSRPTPPSGQQVPMCSASSSSNSSSPSSSALSGDYGQDGLSGTSAGRHRREQECGQFPQYKAKASQRSPAQGFYMGQQHGRQPIIIPVPVPIIVPVPVQTMSISRPAPKMIVAKIKVLGHGHTRLMRECEVIREWRDFPHAYLEEGKSEDVDLVVNEKNSMTPFDYAHLCQIRQEERLERGEPEFTRRLYLMGVIFSVPIPIKVRELDSITRMQLGTIPSEQLLVNTKEALTRVIGDLNSFKYQGNYKFILVDAPLIRDKENGITPAKGYHFFAFIDPASAILVSNYNIPERYAASFEAIASLCCLFLILASGKQALKETTLYKIALRVYDAYHEGGKHAEKYKKKWSVFLTQKLKADTATCDKYSHLSIAPLVAELADELGMLFSVSDLVERLCVDLACEVIKTEKAKIADLEERCPVAGTKEKIIRSTLEYGKADIPELKLLFALFPHANYFYLFDIIEFFRLIQKDASVVDNLPVNLGEKKTSSYKQLLQDDALFTRARKLREDTLTDDSEFTKYDISKRLCEYAEHVNLLRGLEVTPRLLQEYFKHAEEEKPKKRILDNHTSVGAMWLDFELVYKAQSYSCVSVYRRALIDTQHLHPKKTGNQEDLWEFSVIIGNLGTCRFKAIGIGMLAPSYYRHAEKDAISKAFIDFEKRAQGTCGFCMNKHDTGRFRLNYDLENLYRMPQRIPSKTWYHCDEINEDCCWDCAQIHAPRQTSKTEGTRV